MQINIRRFGSPTREMVGLLQSPNPDRPHRAAFLMCRPFGQEAVRTAPIYRAMSDRLAREGCTVLTIDHHGCGDSPGDLVDQSIADWAADTVVASQQLHRDAPAVPLHWFGMGLGANVAACAALTADPSPKCLVLWEPVLDGTGYLQRLMTTHRDEIAREMDRKWHVLVSQFGETEPKLPGSLLGFTVSERLHAELLVTHDLPLRGISARGTRIVMALLERQAASFASADIAQLTLQTIEIPTNWMSVEALGTAIVPQEVPRTLLATL